MYMTLNTKFSGARIVDQMIVPAIWNIKVDIASDGEDHRTSAVAYQKMLFWSTEVLDSVLMAHAADPLGEMLASETTNNVMTLPAPPTDEIIARVLAAKFAAIGETGDLTVLGLDITASDINITYHWVSEIDSDHVLPGIEYIDDKNARIRYKTPWWTRSTADVCDFYLPNENLPADNVTHIGKADILDQFGEQISKTFEVQDNAKPPVSAVVIQPTWPGKK